MGLLVAAFAGGLVFAGAADIAVDLSAWNPKESSFPVARLGAALCVGHDDGDVLATAIVTYGRRPGRSAWGHTSLRFLACESEQLVDVELEYYRMDPSIERWFGKQFRDESWVRDEAYLRQHYGKLMLVRNNRPIDGGFYASELAKNRDIVEAWMPWDPEIQRAVYRTYVDRHARQIETLRQRGRLTGPDYAAMGTNCTLHVREALGIAAGHPGERGGSVFPIANLRRLQEMDSVRWVLHPSPHAARRIVVDGEVVAYTDHLSTPFWQRGLDSRPREVIESELSEAVPVVVRWLLESEGAGSPE